MDRKTMRERVKNYLAIPPSGDGQFTDDRVNGLIDDALSRISTEYDWPYLLTSATVTFNTSGVAAQPSGFGHARELVISTNIARYATLREFLDPLGRPATFVWTVQGSNLLVDPAPTSSLQGTLWYYQREPTLTTDSSSPLMQESNQPLICYFAANLGWLARGEIGRAQTWYAQYEQGMKGARNDRYTTYGPRSVVVGRREPVWASWS